MDEETVQNSDTSTEEEDFSEEDNSDEESKPKPRSAEARIGELTGKVKELEEKLEKKGEEVVPPPPVGDSKNVSPEVQKAIEQLKSLGFTQKEDLDKTIQQVEDRLALNSEHATLSGTYDGADGRPKYDKKEVEKYMRDHAVYDPEVAYKALHEVELLDWALKEAEVKKKKQPYVEKRGESSGEQNDSTITREKIADATKTPEGRAWYERNRKKILSLLQQGEL